MRTAIVNDDGIKSKVRLLKILMMVWTLQTAVAAFAQPVTVITPTNTTWRYFTNGTDPGSEWALPGFDDSSWPQGRGLFGNDSGYPYAFATLIPGPAQGGPITVYFRTHFTWSGPRFGVVLAGTNFVDDGCVVYLNGIEITRFNMPPGPPAFDTQAPAANPGGYPNLTGGEPVLVQMTISLDNLTNGNPNPLALGDNVLAVEVHNAGLGSSDVVFGMSLFPAPDFPCHTDGIQPTNRTVLEGRSTTFLVATTCFPTPTFQWYRNVGTGEELIFGATSNAYTLTNAIQGVDDGVYYCRLNNLFGVVDSRQAFLTILSDDQPPRFLLASVVGPGLNSFRLKTDEPLCADAMACGTEYDFLFNWQINESDNPSIDLGVASVIQINPTTYEFTTSNPRDPTKLYQITVTPVFGEISDLFGNRIRPGTFAETHRNLVFVQGLAGYTGTQDAEIHSNATADTVQGTAAIVTVDNDDAGIAQGLLRFDNIFGAGPTQIPPGSFIVSATLTLNQVDQGSAANFHRMLVTWDQTTATWNSMVNGISNDDVEAVAASDALSTAEPFPNGPMLIDVTASLQAWSAGQANHGWAILSTGTGGWDWNTSESGAATAPMLTVAYQSFVEHCIPTFIAQPPAMLTVGEFHPFWISVSLSNAWCNTLQWTKDGLDISGAHNLTYTVASATLADAGTYRLRIITPDGTLTSSPCVVTVVPDPTGPYVIRVVSSANATNITVQFNELVTRASAQNTANYTLIPTVAVTSAVLGTNNTVTLTTAARSVGTAYSLRIADVTDISGGANPVDPNPTIVALTSSSIVPGAEFGSTWLYNSNNLDGVAWNTAGYVPDASWGSGSGSFGIETSPAVLGAAPAPINTALSANSVAPGDALTTTYFRKDITLPALPAGASYVICHYTDDGHITYLDGVEINRYAMPAGAVTFTNRSTGIANGGEASMRAFTFTVAPGAHALAVELHQAGATSSDVFFAMEVRVVLGPSPPLSISRAGNGDLNLRWNADGNWRLRSAATLTDPYLDVTIPFGSRLGTFTLPAASVTNRSFWLLDYTGRP